MNKNYALTLSKKLNININQVENTIKLLEQDATVPFIARYRKEVTGGLDEVQIIAIRDALLSIKELDKRSAAIIKSLKEMDLYTDEIAHAISKADTMTRLEDIYLPYKPKRKTRASIAREKGLEKLAHMLLSGAYKSQRDALQFIDEDKGVLSAEDALSGASDIIAEMINEDSHVRGNLRIHFNKNSVFSSKLIKKKEKEASKYKDYLDWSENINRAPSHRILAVSVFSDNLKELLLAAPLGRKSILALDPGLRTGSKLVVLDKQGKLLEHTVIYPLAPHNKSAESERILKKLYNKYSFEAIAVGNGTGGREAETFCKSVDFGNAVPVIMVNESGASVYSASEIAREEFPDYDITVRGAVSIGRRLMDPLAELVKIDPKSIGVGQYQHEVDQKMLKSALDDTVSFCVNAVGVELNTASPKLLSYVSGCNNKIASNIVAYRDEHGPFQSRIDLKKVKGLGPKVFEQAAGFLRIAKGKNVLDASAVHPESYGTVKLMAKNMNCTIHDLMMDPSIRKAINLKEYITEAAGLPTLRDIMDELAQPGRDPRESFESFSFDQTVSVPEDLQKGMILPGIVTNVTAFGAFVDVGVHQDGLVHISQLSDTFVRDPNDIVKVGQKVKVTVLDVELHRNRISLSMKE